MDKKYLVAAIGAALTVAGPSAYALDAKISGQVNRAFMVADDGKDSESYYVDNGTSGSRFRFTGSEEVMSGVKAGIVWEMQYQSNDSSSVAQGSRNSSPSLNERHQHVYFQGAFGQISLGQGDGAANGATEVDLSGTSLVNYAGNGDIGGAILYRFTDGTFSTLSIGTSYSQQDFESRYDRFRYDSPKLGPVQLSASRGSKGSSDVNEFAVWVNADMGGAGKLAAAVGYSDEDTTTIDFDNKTIGGSISWLAPFGLNVTAAYSKADVAAATPTTPERDATFVYGKVGYKFGQHAIAVDVGYTDDLAAEGDEAAVTGIGYVFSPKNWAEIYAGFKVHAMDRDNVADLDDIKILTVGSRIKF